MGQTPYSHGRYVRHGVQPHRTDGTKTGKRWFLGDGCIVPVAANDEVITRRASPVKEFHDGMRSFDAGAAFCCLARTGRMHYDHVGLVVVPSESVIELHGEDWGHYQYVQ